jgi:L-cysteine/cystine lyase
MGPLFPDRDAVFPRLKDKVYFNYGGQGMLPRPAAEAIAQTYRRLEELGPFTLTSNRWVNEQTEQLRQTWAEELGISPQTLALTDSVTTGCNIVLWGLDWRPGDHLLLTDCEHPGVIAIAEALAQRRGVTYSTCPIQATLTEGDPVQVLRDHITPQTRILVLSHLLWNTGQVLPLPEILDFAHRRQIPVLVDGAQSAGSLPLNLTELGADYYAFTGHKWFCGPSGVGGLYIAPERLGELLPTYVGWRSIDYDSRGGMTGWTGDARRYEVATSPYPLFIGLERALQIHRQFGSAQSRWERLTQLSAYLWEALQSFKHLRRLSPRPPQAGIVSFQTTAPLTSKKLVKTLDERRIYLRTIGDPDCVRVCCHYFSTEAEIDSLLTALASLDSGADA